MRKLSKLILALTLFFISQTQTKAQTTLAAGDIAFTGYISADPVDIVDRFSFVILTNIQANTVIRFSDYGWRTDLNAFSSGATLESELVFTANAAFNAGTEIMIQGTTATVAGGGSAGTIVYSTGAGFAAGNLNLSTSGDQIFAYQGTFATPVFISGIHKNVLATGNGDPNNTDAANWDGVLGTLNGSSSGKPAALTTGTNAIWIGSVNAIAPFATEWDNARFTCGPDVSTAPLARAAVNNQANWQTSNGAPGFIIPTGCNYMGILSAPVITGQPANSSICQGANTSFTITATGATGYQWQVDNGGGFANVTNNATYSGATTATLNINATPIGFNGFQYRCVASNGSGSTNSNAALLTVNALPVSPSLLTKTPSTGTVADGTPVSATFNAGSGGTGCSDDFRYTTNGGLTYLPYTPGSNISTTGVATGSGIVQIEGRRANCSAGCQGSYSVLASWIVTPLPAGATTLAAGDIAFSGYASNYATVPEDNFSFVLLKNVGPGTIINFTDNGWLSTNVFRTGEQTVTWTAPAGGLPAGTEIKITDLTASRPGGGAAGTVTGTGLQLNTGGDQILAYQGTPAAPTFISAIHMNLLTTLLGDPLSTTAAAWDGTTNNSNSSALPTGLTTGVNCIWIGTQDVPASEFDNSRYANCSAPGVSGSVSALRSLLNNQANWISDNNQPPSFTLPTGCNYLLSLCPTITVTNPGVTTGTAGTAFSQTFTATGGTPPHTFTTVSTLPAGLTLSSAGVLSGTPTESGTFPIVVTATESGGCSGSGSTYTLIIGCPVNTATATPASQTICSGTAITNIVLSGGLAGTTYNWTRDNNPTVTGIAASGSGDISGSLTNTTNAPVTVTFTITPVIYGCNGTPTTATVLVNPTPDAVANPASQSICTGASITTIVLSGAVAGTQFDWTRDNTGTVTGIAASGSGDISGSLTNTTNAPVTVTFTITPTANGCPGTPITATVVVNPIPDATATPASQNRCSGLGITPIVMGGTVGATTFNWVRDNVGTVGGNIPASGSGNISGFFTNNTASPITVTFTITPTANGCPGTPITATVTVNPLPLAIITGTGTFCQNGNTTLTAGFDPNYTYQWGASLFGNPFSNLGTAQTQLFTNSSNVLLTVTNQYGCQDTAMTTVLVADYVFDGALTVGDATQTGRLNRFAVISTCAAPKACPGAFTTTGARLYDSYTITNPRNVPVCARIGITSFCGTNMFCAAYSGSFNPSSVCTNYLADPGSSFVTSGFYEATIPANGTIVIVVHEVNVSTGCAGYRVTVNLPRDQSPLVVTPGNPSCSGGPVTITAPVANGYLWTPGGATTQAINVTPPIGTTPYNVHLTYGNNGCSADSSVNVVVATTPDVAPVNNQYFCTGSPASVNFTSTVPGTTFNWTNTNTAIGLGGSGSGNLSFTATNATAGPITGTITVTPVNGGCTGTPITFDITVATLPLVTSVTEDSVCSPGGVVNLAATGNGAINWFDLATGGTLLNTGTTYSPNITANTTYYVESLVASGPVTNLAMPAQSTTFPGNVRGYWFTAPTDFVITSLYVPTTASSGVQHIAVLKFNGNTPPPVFSATTNAFSILFLTRNNPSSGRIAVNIPVQAGDVIGILGNRANLNSYAPGDYATTIAGLPVQLERLGMQFPLSSTNPQQVWREFGPTTSISRIEFEYSPGPGCTSTPRTPVTGHLIPTPLATATPASQTVCSGPITDIVLTSNVPGTTFAWTRDNTVNVTGIAANGTGDITGTLTNNTTVPQTVTFTITPTSPDGCVGAAITATVTVNAIPTIVCPANINLSNTIGQCGRIVTYSPTITGIPVPVVTYTFTGATTGTGSGDGSGSFFNIGTTNVEIIATNSCGADTCTFTVTINDTENPTITCPAPVTVDCPGDVPTPNVGSVTASDNCPGYVVTFRGDVISGQTCLSRYTITRTYRVTDASGNFVECTQTIIVNDNVPPVITCPAPLTVSCAANVPPVNTALVTATDNCGSLGGPVTITHISDVISAQTCANRYTLTRTYRATDDCGNFAECTQIITVDDQTPPTLTCPAPLTVSCAADVPAPDIAAVTGVSDNCAGAVTVTWQGDVISAQTCANRYTVTRTYRATDVCGNFTECTQIITVNDNTAPIITCPPAVTVSCAANVPPVNIALVTATDNCAGVVTITHISDVISNQTCANRYTVTRTYRATDVCGNFAECTQIITVNDQTPPTLTCPAPVTVSCASAVPPANIASVTGVSDNCAGAVTVTHVGDVISAQTCANRYTITRTYRATDVCGNFAECTQIITVNDQTPPVITCPPALTVSCASAVPAPNTALVTATDNCAGVITITHISDVITNQTCANRYTVTRTYRATDVCGNFSECTQIITVNDQTPPVITCPAAVTVACASAVPAPNTALVIATDNCAGVITITHISDVITNQTCPNRYTLTRTYRATDVCGNFSECTQVITVNDNIAPVITCPANITVTTPVGSCTAVVNFAATATDNCGGTITFNYSTAPGSAFPIGTTTVTATATDACGNSSNCSFTITVIDAQAPVITQQPANSTVCAGQNATFTVAAITSPTAGGPLSYQWQQWNGSAWVNIAGATGTSHTVSSVTLSMNTNTFRVVVTGLCTTINSNPATLFVRPLPTISLTAFPLVDILPNQTTNISATVNPAGGSFVWSFNGSPITGVTGPTYGPININGIGNYTVVYTDPAGCVSSVAQISIGAQFSNNLWVYPNPNTGTFNVRFYNQTGEQVTLKVFNGVGQEMYSQALALGVAYTNMQVNLGNVAAGVYVVKVVNTSGLEIAARRIVVYH